jgi:adenylate cyclase
MRLSVPTKLRTALPRIEMPGARLFCFLAMVVLLAIRVIDPHPLSMARALVFDYFQLLHPRPIPAERPVMIVDIDEDSLVAYGQWPWPRNLIARLIDNLGAAGVAGIGFDAVFPEADRMSAAKFAAGLEGLDEATRRKLMALPSNDQVMAEAVARGRVVLGISGIAHPVEVTGGRRRAATVAAIGGNPRLWLDSYHAILRNVPVLDDAAAGWGIITVMPERDGVIRHVPAVVSDGDQIYPGLSLELLRVATENENLAVKSGKDGVLGVIVRPNFVPTDARGRIWLYASRHDPDKFISARKVLDNSLDKGAVEGRLVLVGTSATGLRDARTTAVESQIPGVELHAQVIETILGNLQLSNPADAGWVEWLAAMIGGLLIIIVLPMIGARWTLALLLVDAAGLIWFSWDQFIRNRLLYDPVFPVVTTAVIFVVMAYASFAREEAKERQVRGAFGRYLASEMIDMLVANPKLLRLGGEKREMTMLFCDVRGFTSISELYDAEHLTTLINKFLTPMSEAILAERGTIDKYMGDCVMAFWNAPLDVPDHAAHACRAAIEMQKRLVVLNRELEADAIAQDRKFIPLRIGIGINSGPVVVGNMGSEQRFDYSVMGDNVNLASRLEGLSKFYGVTVVLGENTFAMVPSFACIEVDLVRVKGKETPVHVYALLGDESLASSHQFRALLDEHAALLTSYRSGNWREALDRLERCQKMSEGLGLAGLYALYQSRLFDFAASPPGEGWDGVYTAESK